MSPQPRPTDPVAFSFGVTFVAVALVFLFGSDDAGSLLALVWPVAAFGLGATLIATTIRRH